MKSTHGLRLHDSKVERFRYQKIKSSELKFQVNKTVVRKKVQRLLGKCHIGLNYSQELNHLIDDLPFLVRYIINDLGGC